VPAHSTVCLGCSVVRSEVCSFRCQHFSIRFSRCSRLSIDFPVVGFTGLVFLCSFSSVLARARARSHLRQGPVFSRAVRSCLGVPAREVKGRGPISGASLPSLRLVFSSLGFLLESSQRCLVPQWLHRSILLVPTRIARRPHRSFPRVSFSCSRQKGAGQFSSPWSSRSVFAQA
jgi:hypothetical protein